MNPRKENRLLSLAGALGLGIFFIVLLHFTLGRTDSRAAQLIIGFGTTDLYPLTIQNISILVFFAGLGEIFIRFRTCRFEEQLCRVKLLPESDEVVLSRKDVMELRRRILGHYGEALPGMLLNLVNRCILQFQTTRSVSETHNLLNSLLEIYAHRVDLGYTFARYIAWLIPTLGFIGTIIGIAGSLQGFGVQGEEPDFDAIKGALYTAFDTTLISLVLSAILVYFIHYVSAREERGINRSAEYCLVNLINRLYEK